jgi:hypothetical protein
MFCQVRATLLITAMVVACSGPTPDAADSTDAGQADTVAVIRVAEVAAEQLRSALIQRLSNALQTEGAAGAIDVCAIDALPLSDSIARAAGAGIDVRRTARRVRNPINAPDSLETQALAWFEEALERGQQPGHLLQRETADTYRYYAPLRIAALCLQCHGPVDELSAEVRQALARRYPTDAATGYAEGDFRGLIRITVPAATITRDDGDF